MVVLPASIPGYALLGNRIFATSTETVESHASQLVGVGYGARLDLSPYGGNGGFETPAEPERFHVGDGSRMNMELVLRACRELDGWLQERVRVVIHCGDGRGATGAVLACYLAWKHDVTADEALRRVREAAKARGYDTPVPRSEHEDVVRQWSSLAGYLKA